MPGSPQHSSSWTRHWVNTSVKPPPPYSSGSMKLVIPTSPAWANRSTGVTTSASSTARARGRISRSAKSLHSLTIWRCSALTGQAGKWVVIGSPSWIPPPSGGGGNEALRSRAPKDESPPDDSSWPTHHPFGFTNRGANVWRVTSPVKRAFKYRFFAKRARYPLFKSRKKSRRSAEYTSSAFRFRDGALTLAKMAEPLDVVWSRPLPRDAKPSTVTVSQDAAGRWFPSSKLCSVCGSVRDKLPLHIRSWTCGCGATHDRDVNAARNILAAGLAVSACGAGVRPQRSSPGGQSVMKQEALRREL